MSRTTLCSLLLAVGASAALAQPTFAPPLNYPTTNVGAVNELEMADIDGDCFPDMILADIVGFTVSHFRIALNDGMGGFPVVDFPTTDIPPTEIELVDLTGDGLPDLVVSTLLGHVCAFPNQGGGTFDFNTVLWASPVSNAPISEIDTGDIDGDGDLDLVAGPFISGGGMNQGSFVYLNTGTAFTLATTIPTTTIFAGGGAGEHDIQLHDIDQDGLCEIFVLDTFANTVTLFPNIGGGSFGTPVTLYSGPAIVTGMTFADFFNQDGDLDLILFAGNQLRASVNVGGALGAFGALGSPTPNAFRGAGADFDLDGDADLVHGHDVQTVTPWVPVTVSENVGGSWSTSQTVAPSGNRMVPADLDLDGYPDLAIFANGLLRVVRNTTGGGSYAAGMSGLGIAVNGGPFDGSPKSFGVGDTITFGTEVSGQACLLGALATIFLNLPPGSNLTGVTSLGASGVFPNLEIVWPFSMPSGTVFTAGSSLAWAVPGVIPLPLPPVLMGDPPISITTTGPIIPSGQSIRLQAIYFHPIPAHISSFGLVATNAAVFTAL